MNRVMSNLGGLTAEWRVRSPDEQKQLINEKIAVVQSTMNKATVDYCCKELCHKDVGVNYGEDHKKIPEDQG